VVEQREDALDRIRHALPRWLQEHRMDSVTVRVEDREENILLPGKEVVETSRVDAGVAQDVGDAGGSIALAREEPHRGVDDAIPGVGRHGGECVE
jgi:hypothetical protein